MQTGRGVPIARGVNRLRLEAFDLVPTRTGDDEHWRGIAIRTAAFYPMNLPASLSV